MHWLLEKSAWERMATGYAGMNDYCAQQMAYEAAYNLSHSDGLPDIISSSGSTAEIRISGLITNRPDMLARFFGPGNVLYSEIIQALALAQGDPGISDITLLVDSPGGSFAGFFDTVDALRAVVKPVNSVVSNMALSAAFGLVTQTKGITARNASAMLGSIGVVRSFSVDENEISLTSSNAPNKAPDVTTEEGKAIVRKELDDAAVLFTQVISEGRGVTAEKVDSDFGRGGIVLANEALELGMIDKIAGSSFEVPAMVVDLDEGQTEEEAFEMNANELQMSDRSCFDQVFALGVAKERDRVSAHLTYGKSYDAMAIASKAIEDGSEMTESLRAQYQTAQVNKTALDATNEDEVETAAALGKLSSSSQTGAQQDDEDMLVAKTVASALTGGVQVAS